MQLLFENRLCIVVSEFINIAAPVSNSIVVDLWLNSISKKIGGDDISQRLNIAS